MELNSYSLMHIYLCNPKTCLADHSNLQPKRKVSFFFFNFENIVHKIICDVLMYEENRMEDYVDFKFFLGEMD